MSYNNTSFISGSVVRVPEEKLLKAAININNRFCHISRLQIDTVTIVIAFVYIIHAMFVVLHNIFTRGG